MDWILSASASRKICRHTVEGIDNNNAFIYANAFATGIFFQRMLVPESLAFNEERKVYFNLMSFEDCHSPWILHSERAKIVPGLLVLNHVTTW